MMIDSGVGPGTATTGVDPSILQRSMPRPPGGSIGDGRLRPLLPDSPSQVTLRLFKKALKRNPLTCKAEVHIEWGGWKVTNPGKLDISRFTKIVYWGDRKGAYPLKVDVTDEFDDGSFFVQFFQKQTHRADMPPPPQPPPRRAKVTPLQRDWEVVFNYFLMLGLKNNFTALDGAKAYLDSVPNIDLESLRLQLALIMEESGLSHDLLAEYAGMGEEPHSIVIHFVPKAPKVDDTHEVVPEDTDAAEGLGPDEMVAAIAVFGVLMASKYGGLIAEETEGASAVDEGTSKKTEEEENEMPEGVPWVLAGHKIPKGKQDLDPKTPNFIVVTKAQLEKLKELKKRND